MHIGWRKIGNLQQTRYYVPGKTLWGALTARIARNDEDPNYEKIGNYIDNSLRFTYFYPSDNEEKITLFPWEKRDEFEWKYIGSTVNTALDSEDLKSKKAKDGSLHETEYMAPKTREGKQVYLTGYIFEHEENSKLNWKDALPKLQIGGERTYGWGRVGFDKSKSCTEVNEIELDGYDVELGEESPIIRLSKKTPVISHVLTDEGINRSASSGNIETFLGLETTREKRFGAEISAVQICWSPGTEFSNDNTFVIGKKGIWNSKS
jgi:hypothetical protein